MKNLNSPLRSVARTAVRSTLGLGIGLTLTAAGMVAPTPFAAQAAPRPAAAPDDDLRQEMRDTADGSVGLRSDGATGKVGFVTARGPKADLLPGVQAGTRSAAVDKASAYLDRFAPAFGADAGDLVRAGTRSDDYGTVVTYTQEHAGVPVFGSMLRVHLDQDGDLTAVNGELVPVGDADVEAQLSAREAGARAVRLVKAQPPGDQGDADTTGIEAAATDLVLYRTGLVQGVAGGDTVLVYQVEVTNRANVRDMVFVDATTGKVVNRYSMIHDALERHVYEQAYDPANEVWKEGDAYPGSLNEDQRNIVDATGESYWFFQNAFGRDSYDAAGHKMEIVNNDPRISCPNANWNGTTTNYCNGVTSDDVVAHEWGHAYTEYTHGLIYQWQPGALNESYSDIWGETVDLINGRADEDEGDITTPRSDELCSTHSPLPVVATINSPESIAKICEAGPAAFGPQLDETGVTGDVALGLTAGGSTLGCEAITTDLTGKIALVDRGTCAFTIKVKNAQDAGATAVLVADNVEAAPAGMSGEDPTITIPSVRIRLSDGNLIKSALPDGPVNVTLELSPEQREDSYRWLMGEDSTAFGGAIRDMWRPTCYGDAGKVTDAEYYCAADDGGGVHSNSGVPNHAYALTVDGGDYNGHTLTGIGLTKAAAVYYRAMTAYQTPATDFVDHADSLKAACLDLVDQPLNALSTDPDSSSVSDQVISAEDCATFDEVAAAVEFRTEPTQCNFQPMFDPDTPALCGDGFATETVWTEDFEDGLAGWGTDQEVVYAGGTGAPWELSTTAPGGHSGGVAYGPAPDRGQCDQSAADFSTSDSIISPTITMPKGKLTGQKLSFEHYVATELGYDGGNVKYKLGGKWRIVPKAAYLFNAPTTLADEAAGNTNPLAGEDGFTGTDGGEVTGSWGTSIIDLAALRIKGGTKFQIRFDIGRDGCGGLDGWYVDNVDVSFCKATPAGREND